MTVEEMEKISYQHPIIFFDGLCVLCAGSVRFILKHDKKGVFRYCPLQSNSATSIAKEIVKDEDYETVVALFRGKKYFKSDVTLLVIEQLGGAWKLLGFLKIFPRSIRDWFYAIIVKHRYSWFGKRDSCYRPTAEQESRFL